MNCKICKEISHEFARGEILNKYSITYYLCPNCGFLQTEEPFWLKEAYLEPINVSDIGLVKRNFDTSRITNMMIVALLNRYRKGRFLDYGAGYGLLVRLMRDRGKEFYWHDRYCPNIFAKGFEHQEGQRYDLVTAFEVFEHLPDPLAELTKIFSLGDNVLFTTECLPVPAPNLDAWWYYGPEHGQHISFYTPKSLQLMASYFGCHYYNGGSFHLFTKQKISPLLFGLFSNKKVSGILDDIIYP